ncbi:unnamed protein product [Gadus morhua 'NCC']
MVQLVANSLEVFLRLQRRLQSFVWAFFCLFIEVLPQSAEDDGKTPGRFKTQRYHLLLQGTVGSREDRSDLDLNRGEASTGLGEVKPGVQLAMSHDSNGR